MAAYYWRAYRILHIGGIGAILLLLILSGFVIPKSDYAAEKTEEVKKEIIVIEDAAVPKAKKEALLILPGLGDSNRGRRHQKRYFTNRGYDLFIPDFKDRKSIEATVLKLEKFFFDNHLDEYKKVHVFSYIMGSWVLNKFIQKNGRLNIASIVYDRSPLQERAPRVIAERIPLIGTIAVGKVVIDMSNMTYPSIEKEDLRIGILVESRATPLIKLFRKRTLSYGDIDWHILDFQQKYNDLIYIPLNHDEMYLRFDVVGHDILHFIETGEFTKDSRRIPYDWDAFKTQKEEKW